MPQENIEKSHHTYEGESLRVQGFMPLTIGHLLEVRLARASLRKRKKATATATPRPATRKAVRRANKKEKREVCTSLFCFNPSRIVAIQAQQTGAGSHELTMTSMVIP